MNILISGATGRMGQMIRTVIAEDAHCQVGGLLEYAEHPAIGTIQQPENLPLHHDFTEAVRGCQVIIDFSLPAGCIDHAEMAAKLGIPFVSGTTGLSAPQQAQLDAAAQQIPVFWAANMSLGVALVRALVRQAAQTLAAENFDIEVIEQHHRNKIDAPSGTAIALGEAAAEGRGVDHTDHAVYDRPRIGETRDTGTIGYASVRGGGIVGDHEVLFLGQYEQISIGHHAMKRELFASGAVRAAKWLVQQSAGLYGMDDIFA